MNRTLVFNIFDNIDNSDLAGLLMYKLPEGDKISVYSLSNDKKIFGSKDESETECEVYDFWMRARTQYEQDILDGKIDTGEL